MPKEYIITMTAGNRTGILSAVTKAMAELGADLREASQTVVRGYFTMIFSAEFPDRIEETVIRDHLQDACRPFDIEIRLRDPSTHLSAYSAATAECKPYRLRLGGRNQPGALRKLSQGDCRRLHIQHRFNNDEQTIGKTKTLRRLEHGGILTFRKTLLTIS